MIRTAAAIESKEPISSQPSPPRKLLLLCSVQQQLQGSTNEFIVQTRLYEASTKPQCTLPKLKAQTPISNDLLLLAFASTSCAAGSTLATPIFPAQWLRLLPIYSLDARRKFYIIKFSPRSEPKHRRCHGWMSPTGLT
ncbi:hypothetical protein CDL15_Pgr026646 [Punica granatum]|uniref:Uncharacterized protein n=1 Tax=Punica granatum TaxID=22663 RepID=A0A218WL42_PUNGR|nr:hypothetical protein CDL15_Pgr026646 [Punica granatum]